MIKSGEFVLTGSGIVAEEADNTDEVDPKSGTIRNSEFPRPSNTRIDSFASENSDSSRNDDESEPKKSMPLFTMIFNKYNNKLNMRPSGKNQDDKSKTRNGSKYTIIFNKDVTVRSKLDGSQSCSSKTDLKRTDDGVKCSGKGAVDPPLRGIESDLSSMKLNDAETLMNLYGRSNLFIPELTINSLLPEDESARNKRNEKLLTDNRRRNDPGLRMYNSLTSLPKNKANRRADNLLKNKIASMTSLETQHARELPRKHVPSVQERKLFRVRSLDLSESVTSSDSDLEKPFTFQKTPEDCQSGKMDTGGESPRKSDKKSRGDAVRKGDREGGCRKQVQWKSEVDVIYFESHQAADGDSSGEILGRVMEPLREEWEQQRTGFYTKMVLLSLGSHSNEHWQSLLKI